MSIEALKEELAGLAPADQRRVMAYLVALQESHSTAYRESLARKIDDRNAAHFATLEQLDQRLASSRDDQQE